MTLRPYQRQCLDNIPPEGNTLLCLPTGAGKTYTFTTYIKEQGLPTCVMAHRSELVGQMSLALAHAGIYHRLIASDQTVSHIIKAHRQELGKGFFDPTAPTLCSSVDTLVRRKPDKVFDSVKLWVVDEAHHLLKENKWGKAVGMFKNARGLGVTATPKRADGKGLGRHNDGVFDQMTEGPTGDELISMGYLSDYDLCGPEVKDVDWSDLKKGQSGDYTQKSLSTVTKGSRQLVGSIVGQYLKRASGKLGITFCVDIEHAEIVTEQFKNAGVPAALVTSKTPFLVRLNIMRKFRNREILMLINVDLFGEGVDVPAVEVVVMGRKTASFSLYSQQFGRALRPVYAPNMPLNTAEERRLAMALGPKPKALVIDHVENWRQHLLPTASKRWSLDAGEKRSKTQVDNEFKLQGCRNAECAKPYRAILVQCPYCGHAPERTAMPRATPEEVDGDLEMIDLQLVRELQAKAEKVMGPCYLPAQIARPAALKIMKDHSDRSRAQKSLRESIAVWAGYKKHEGLSIPEIQKFFYLKFKTDILSAQSLNAKDAVKLEGEVDAHTENLKRSLGFEQSTLVFHGTNGGGALEEQRRGVQG